MMKEFTAATGIYRNGRWDILRLLLVGAPFLLFVLWRLSSHGVSGSDEVLRAIERDLLTHYKTAMYQDAGLLDSDPAIASAESAAGLNFDGLVVRFSNVSMSGSLFGWSVNDPIGDRFDYVIENKGVIQEQERNVYRCTHRQTRTSVWECNAISYYLKYL